MPMPRILRLCRGRARGKKEDTTDDRRGTKEGEGTAAEKLGTEVVVPRGTRSPTRRGVHRTEEGVVTGDEGDRSDEWRSIRGGIPVEDRDEQTTRR